MAEINVSIGSTPSVQASTDGAAYLGKGDPGVGIEDIAFVREDADGNVYRIYLTDGTSYYFTAPKGAEGAPGKDGEPGKDGTDGKDGAPGKDGIAIQPDWNQNDSTANDYIKNRPGGYTETSGINIEWDGNLEGHYVVQQDEVSFVKVSDVIFTAQDLIGATVAYVMDGESGTIVGDEDNVETNDGVAACSEFAISVSAPQSFIGMQFEQAGTYFVYVAANTRTTSLAAGTSKDYKIPGKYLDLSEVDGIKTEVDGIKTEVDGIKTEVDGIKTTKIEYSKTASGTTDSALLSATRFSLDSENLSGLYKGKTHVAVTAGGVEHFKQRDNDDYALYGNFVMQHQDGTTDARFDVSYDYGIPSKPAVAHKRGYARLAIGDPKDSWDAATKKYVDDAVAQAGGSGGGAYKVSVTVDEDTGLYVADKTFAEILAAYNAGSMPYMTLDAGAANILALQYVDDSAMQFGCTYIDNNQLVVCAYEITSENNVNDYSTYLDVSSLIS